MTNLTDPAREFAELCASLHVHSDKPGDVFLAARFQVAPWSSEFYQIVFAILDRARRLAAIIDMTDLDDDFKAEARQHIKQIASAFGKNSLTNTWHSTNMGASLLAPTNVQPIKMISPMVRAKVSYPRLDNVELADLRAMIAELDAWLRDHQLAEQDFIRELIIEGIAQLDFRLERFRWFGWGYAVASLREVIAAYMALQQASQGAAVSPDAEAMLRKTQRLLAAFLQKAGVAKETFERADWLLRAMGAVSLIQHGTTVSGLLTYMGDG